jgi:L-rhamnose mutarotase
MTRYGMVIQLKPNMIEQYKYLHRNVWQQVLDVLNQNNIRNYSIFLKDCLLFSYFEYHGKDFSRDMKKIAEEPITQKWWKETEPCQEPLKTKRPTEWWAEMEEVFHLD